MYTEHSGKIQFVSNWSQHSISTTDTAWNTQQPRVELCLIDSYIESNGRGESPVVKTLL
jgi:hypothetical protein